MQIDSSLSQSSATALLAKYHYVDEVESETEPYDPSASLQRSMTSALFLQNHPMSHQDLKIVLESPVS